MKQFISIFLSVFLLVNSTGITYAQHFCGDYEMMAKITLGQEKLSCNMAGVQDICNDDVEDETHTCCNNTYTQLDIDDTFAQTSFEFQIAPVLVFAYTQVFLLTSEIVQPQKALVYTNYYPPPLIKNIPVLYESFLI